MSVHRPPAEDAASVRSRILAFLKTRGPSFSCYPVEGIFDDLSRVPRWLSSAQFIWDAPLSIHLFVSRFERRVAGWAVESKYRSGCKAAKEKDSGSPASLPSDGQGMLAFLVAVCVLPEHAEDTGRSARSAWGRSSALLQDAKGVSWKWLRDTNRRRAEPGRGDLACRRRQRMLSDAATRCKSSGKSHRRQELEYLESENGRRSRDYVVHICVGKSVQQEILQQQGYQATARLAVHAVASNELVTSLGYPFKERPISWPGKVSGRSKEVKQKGGEGTVVGGVCMTTFSAPLCRTRVD